MRYFLVLVFLLFIDLNDAFSAGFTLSEIPVPGQSEQLADCNVRLEGNILIIENSVIARKYNWNNGDLSSAELSDKKTNYKWLFAGKQADMTFQGAGKATNGQLKLIKVADNGISPEHLQAEVLVTLGSLQVKRIFRIYPKTPAIACDIFLKGSVKGNWINTVSNAGDLRNIESAKAAAEGKAVAPVIEHLAVPGKHWRLKAVQFSDITDRNNNLVEEYNQLLYVNESRLPGNLLFADELLTDHGIFILKEAPTSAVQLAYPGFDFAVRMGNITVAGIGLSPYDLKPDEWTQGYGFVTGVASGGELGRLTALRSYQEKIRRHLPGRDDMILMNTWGDRSMDKQISEKFTIKELETAHRLGITHFQLDDGWQTGKAADLSFVGDKLIKIWEYPDYWKPNPLKFPNGLAPVFKRAKELGIEACLWFNPSKDNSYVNWKKDAEVLINLYRQHGVRTFKIDGVQINDKLAEINLRSMLDTVMQVTGNQAVFNLDVTAGKRYGYHYFNQYGNIFLENRYTDWSNYYPHWTLRNLWMLSKYVPAQNLQIEFLNNFRNQDKYPADDVLAPAKVSFEYGFALTMMAQPLAWMEATGLPEKAFKAAPVIKKYQSIQTAIHAGRVFPIGEEPSGTSWTGFQSAQNNQGYMLAIRELNAQRTGLLQTWLPANRKIKLTAVLGYGKDFVTTTDALGRITFNLAGPNSYALYEYKLL